MERVDVVVIGGGVAGLAAAQAAAAGGVRTILVEQTTDPDGGAELIGLSRSELTGIGLKTNSADRVVSTLQVNDEEPAPLNDECAIYAALGSKVQKKLLTRAKKASVELRAGTPAEETVLDPEGWIVHLSGGEPIRAPILVVADGARSTTLRTLGIADAQLFSPSGAEVVSFLCAHWAMKDADLEAFKHYRIIERNGPMSRYELLPGKKSLTLAIGPVWASATDDHPWPSAAHPSAMRELEIACRVLGLPKDPKSIGVEEWRVDALPSPATFDGGLVIGAAAGHKPARPLTAAGTLIRQGEIAGSAAAQAVLDKEWSAAALSDRLGPAYEQTVSTATACRWYEAHGLRAPRALPPEFWKRGQAEDEAQA